MAKAKWAELDEACKVKTNYTALEIAIGLALEREASNLRELEDAEETAEEANVAQVIAHILGDGEDDAALELGALIEHQLRQRFTID